MLEKDGLQYQYGAGGHSHAVTAVSDGWRYEYDPNGNLARKVSQPWLLLELYLPVVMSSLPEEALDSPPESPESQSAPVSPYPPPEAQSRAEPAGLVAWLHSAWDALVSWLGGGTQTAQAAALDQKAQEEMELAQAANEISDRYVLLTVIFASVLFFGGISGKFQSKAIDLAMLVLSGLVFLVGLGILVTYPIQ